MLERESRVSLEAYACLYPDRIQLDGVTVLRSDEAPESPMLNRIVGLGIDDPANESLLDAALDAIGDDVDSYVSISPGARPEALPAWLRERGLEPGWSWMAFRRGADDPPKPSTSLRLVRVGKAEAEAFGRVIAAGYGLPDAVAPWAAGAHAAGWDCWLVLEDDEPAAAAGVFVSEGVGYLGLAATLPGHRGKGAQSTLLARRIEHARAAGCDVVVTETGERRDDRPSNSYRNILRAGFEEAAVISNWLRRGTARATRTP